MAERGTAVDAAVDVVLGEVSGAVPLSRVSAEMLGEARLAVHAAPAASAASSAASSALPSKRASVSQGMASTAGLCAWTGDDRWDEVMLLLAGLVPSSR